MCFCKIISTPKRPKSAFSTPKSRRTHSSGKLGRQVSFDFSPYTPSSSPSNITPPSPNSSSSLEGLFTPLFSPVPYRLNSSSSTLPRPSPGRASTPGSSPENIPRSLSRAASRLSLRDDGSYESSFPHATFILIINGLSLYIAEDNRPLYNKDNHELKKIRKKGGFEIKLYDMALDIDLSIPQRDMSISFMSAYKKFMGNLDMMLKFQTQRFLPENVDSKSLDTIKKSFSSMERGSFKYKKMLLEVKGYLSSEQFTKKPRQIKFVLAKALNEIFNIEKEKMLRDTYVKICDGCIDLVRNIDFFRNFLWDMVESKKSFSETKREIIDFQLEIMQEIKEKFNGLRPFMEGQKKAAIAFMSRELAAIGLMGIEMLPIVNQKIEINYEHIDELQQKFIGYIDSMTKCAVREKLYRLQTFLFLRCGLFPKNAFDIVVLSSVKTRDGSLSGAVSPWRTSGNYRRLSSIKNSQETFYVLDAIGKHDKLRHEECCLEQRPVFRDDELEEIQRGFEADGIARLPEIELQDCFWEIKPITGEISISDMLKGIITGLGGSGKKGCKEIFCMAANSKIPRFVRRHKKEGRFLELVNVRERLWDMIGAIPSQLLGDVADFQGYFRVLHKLIYEYWSRQLEPMVLPPPLEFTLVEPQFIKDESKKVVLESKSEYKSPTPQNASPERGNPVLERRVYIPPQAKPPKPVPIQPRKPIILTQPHSTPGNVYYETQREIHEAKVHQVTLIPDAKKEELTPVTATPTMGNPEVALRVFKQNKAKVPRQKQVTGTPIELHAPSPGIELVCSSVLPEGEPEPLNKVILEGPGEPDPLTPRVGGPVQGNKIVPRSIRKPIKAKVFRQKLPTGTPIKLHNPTLDPVQQYIVVSKEPHTQTVTKVTQSPGVVVAATQTENIPRVGNIKPKGRRAKVSKPSLRLPSQLPIQRKSIQLYKTTIVETTIVERIRNNMVFFGDDCEREVLEAYLTRPQTSGDIDRVVEKYWHENTERIIKQDNEYSKVPQSEQARVLYECKKAFYDQVDGFLRKQKEIENILVDYTQRAYQLALKGDGAFAECRSAMLEHFEIVKEYLFGVQGRITRYGQLLNSLHVKNSTKAQAIGIRTMPRLNAALTKKEILERKINEAKADQAYNMANAWLGNVDVEELKTKGSYLRDVLALDRSLGVFEPEELQREYGRYLEERRKKLEQEWPSVPCGFPAKKNVE